MIIVIVNFICMRPRRILYPIEQKIHFFFHRNIDNSALVEWFKLIEYFIIQLIENFVQLFSLSIDLIEKSTMFHSW